MALVRRVSHRYGNGTHRRATICLGNGGVTRLHGRSRNSSGGPSCDTFQIRSMTLGSTATVVLVCQSPRWSSAGAVVPPAAGGADALLAYLNARPRTAPPSLLIALLACSTVPHHEFRPGQLDRAGGAEAGAVAQEVANGWCGDRPDAGDGQQQRVVAKERVPHSCACWPLRQSGREVPVAMPRCAYRAGSPRSTATSGTGLSARASVATRSSRPWLARGSPAAYAQRDSPLRHRPVGGSADAITTPPTSQSGPDADVSETAHIFAAQEQLSVRDKPFSGDSRQDARVAGFVDS